MAKTKITRKQMKRDEFARTVGGMTATVERHGKGVAMGIIALLLVAGAGYAGWSYSKSLQAESMIKLAAVQKAESSLAGGLESADPTSGVVYATPRQKYEEVVKLADVVLADHPSSQAAKWAVYYKAIGQKELGGLPQALATLEPLTGPNEGKFVASSALLLKAHILEAQGNLDAAVDTLSQLASSAPDQFPVDLALANQARVLESMGKVKEAQDVYRRLSEEFPQSPFAGEALRRIQPS